MLQVRGQTDQGGIYGNFLSPLQCHLGVQARPVWQQNSDDCRPRPDFLGCRNHCYFCSTRNGVVYRAFYRGHCRHRQGGQSPAAAAADAPAAVLLRAGERLTSRPLSHTTGIPSSRCLRAALARGSREPGQALTGAAISGVLLCEGHSRAAAFL